MAARILDGSAISTELRAALSSRVEHLARRGHAPGLAVVLVGDNPASQVYVRNKVKACADLGIHSELQRLPVATTETGLLTRIAALNADQRIHGILVQLPLPPQIDAHRVIEAIALEKDVDGFHLMSAGALMTGQIEQGVGYRPCTPYGIMKILEHAGIPVGGSRAVVIGRSNIVGKPMAMMLLAGNATVTICHSATQGLAAIVREADIVVAAVGRRNVVTREMIKPGAAVVDVGMNRDDNGKLCGDVDFEGVREVAGWLTPVPGGVGPMTITMLLSNTVESAERSAK